MGINAYFQLKTDLVPLSQGDMSGTLVQSWSDVFDDIREFRNRKGLHSQALIFTELGYTFKQHSSVEPWSYSGKSVIKSGETSYLVDWDEQPVDYSERYKAMKALQEVARRPVNHFFRGLLYWKLSTNLNHEEVEPYVVCIASDSVDPVLECLRAIFGTKMRPEVSAVEGRKIREISAEADERVQVDSGN